MSDKLFSTLSLSTAELNNLNSLGYANMTPIQAACLPAIIEGKDVIAQAKTGSGKTAAFGIGLLSKIKTRHLQTQSLILCPTRELAEQVCNELRRLARAIPNTKVTALCGGKPLGGQFASLEVNPHIVVGTPGRILKHLDKGSLDLSNLKSLVLDEADRMLDMGFLDDIKTVISKTPSNKQTLLFSATYPKEVKAISQSVQNNPLDVHVESRHAKSDIKQIFFAADDQSKSDLLLDVLKHFRPTSCVIFCNRKQQCDQVVNELRNNNIDAKALHGDLDQNQRDLVLTQFANQSLCVLVATDVAARGLDIKDLPMVINFDLAHDPEVHVHRIGRTGRAGSQGIAISLYTSNEMHKVIAIEDECKQALNMEKTSTLQTHRLYQPMPDKITLCINGGRKDKLRPGDILGALTADQSITGDAIGKIDRFDRLTYVAVERTLASAALKLITHGKIKGRQFKARKIN